jgi:hypothetical protein
MWTCAEGSQPGSGSKSSSIRNSFTLGNDARSAGAGLGASEPALEFELLLTRIVVGQVRRGSLG